MTSPCASGGQPSLVSTTLCYVSCRYLIGRLSYTRTVFQGIRGLKRCRPQCVSTAWVVSWRRPVTGCSWQCMCTSDRDQGAAGSVRVHPTEIRGHLVARAIFEAVRFVFVLERVGHEDSPARLQVQLPVLRVVPLRHQMIQMTILHTTQKESPGQPLSTQFVRFVERL